MSSDNGMPEEYDAVTSDHSAWAVKEEGNTIEGILLGHFTRGTGHKQRGFYQVKLISPCKAVIGRGEDTNVNTLVPGEIVSFDETEGLKRDLRPLTSDGGKYQVWIRYLQKIELEGGNSFWRMKIGKKVLSPPRSLDKEDDLPF